VHLLVGVEAPVGQDREAEVQVSGLTHGRKNDAARGYAGEHEVVDVACPQERSDERLLRAELVVALGVGIAVVRSAVGLQPLRDATPDELAGPLREVVDALLPPGS
jgi:Tetracyclin repressor-like, C-terminal domain